MKMLIALMILVGLSTCQLTPIIVDPDRQCPCRWHHIYAVDWSGSMKWEDTNGITGAQLANDILALAHLYADKVTAFRHSTTWAFHATHPFPPIPPIPLGLVGGGTSYSPAFSGVMNYMNSNLTWRTCVYFVGDGTGYYNATDLANFINFLNGWSKKTGCPYCVKCIVTRTTVSTGYGVNKFKEMCDKMGAEFVNKPTNSPNQGYGQYPQYKSVAPGANLDLDNPNPTSGGASQFRFPA